MKRVKGSILVDFVKTIRADKTGVYERYLTPEDKAIVTGKILPSAWYPYETFKNCFNAIFEVLAKKNLDQARQWGKFYGEAIMSGIYKGLLRQDEPLEYIKKSQVHIKNFYDFGKIEVISEKPNQVLIKAMDFDPSFPPLYYIMLGWWERTVELCGAKNIQSEFVRKSWEGAEDTAFRIKWEL